MMGGGGISDLGPRQKHCRVVALTIGPRARQAGRPARLVGRQGTWPRTAWR